MNCKRNFFSAKIAIVIIAFALLFVFVSRDGSPPAQNKLAYQQITYDDALGLIKSKEIKEISLKNDKAKLEFRTGGAQVVSHLSEIQRDELLNAAMGLNFDNFQHSIKVNLLRSSDSLDEPVSISNPMDKIFQIIFILFFISPPLIVILLFLIWCELKKRNDKS